MTTINDVSALVDAYAKQQYLLGKSDQQASDKLVFDNLTAQVADLKIQVQDLTADLEAAQNPSQPPPPPPSTVPLLGVYMSGNNSGLDGYVSTWKQKPNWYSYYLVYGSGSSVNIPPHLKSMAVAGYGSHMTLSTRITDTSWITWADIASGKYDAKLVQFIKALDVLGPRMIVSLECEPDNQYDITARTGKKSVILQGQTPAQYVAAANHFADLIHKNSKNVESGLHLSGWRGAAVNKQFLFDKTKMNNVSWDPYKNLGHPVDQTATGLFQTFINETLIPAGYTTTKRHIFETGIQVGPNAAGKEFTSQQQIDFWNSVPAAMKTLSIESVTYFRSNSGGTAYVTTDPKVDQALAAMVDASI